MKFNPMQNKTTEERKAIAAKAHATRRARLDSEVSARQDALKYAGGLREQIDELEDRLSYLHKMETMNAISAALGTKALLRDDEIASAALPWENVSGVYFLLDGDEVVYVGQAIDVYSRMSQHKTKMFDRYAFVPCAVDVLDKLESLYIHCLRPRLNGNQRNGVKFAPIALDDLIRMTHNARPNK